MLHATPHQRVPYHAPISATQIVDPRISGGDYRTPSGLHMGGQKQRGPSSDHVLSRMGVGPRVHNSQGAWREKDRRATYLTQDEVRGIRGVGDVTTVANSAAQEAWPALQRAVKSPDCLWLAGAVALFFVLRKGA